jgi:SnoaL-like domain
MTNITTQILLDRAAISDVFHNYACGVDTRDWKLFRSCFTDDLVADFTTMAPGNLFTGADKWCEWVARSINALDATQHIITNHVHRIEGDKSQSQSYLQAQHVLRGRDGAPDMHYLIGGYYKYDMVRAGAEWKIKRYSLNITWQTGDPEIFRIGMARKKAAE